jgi:hypothetical protein
MGLSSYGKRSTFDCDCAWQLLNSLAIRTFADAYGLKGHGPLGLTEVICLAHQERPRNAVNFGGNMHVANSCSHSLD